MRTHIPFIAEMFAKFRVLNIRQLEILCEGRCNRRRIYEHISDLIDWNWIERYSHRKKDICAYRATSDFLAQTLGREEEKCHALRLDEIEHHIECSNSAIELMKFSYVSGVCLEHGLGRDDLKYFCHERRPDGVIQITRPGPRQYELAIEVERSPKPERKVKRILDQYTTTFQSTEHLCHGVVIIASHSTAFGMYQRLIKDVPISVRERFILFENLKSSEQTKKYLGTKFSSYLSNPHLPAPKARTLCARTIQYLPMNTRELISPARIQGHA